MNQKTKQAFYLAAIGIELSSLQSNSWQSYLPLAAGIALVFFIAFQKDPKKD